MFRCSEPCGLVLLVAGAILATVAISTSEWSTFGGSNGGLWRFCPADGGCVDVDTSSSLSAVRTLILIGDVVALMGIVLMIVSMVVSTADGPFPFWITPTVGGAGIVAGIMTLISVNVYEAHVHNDIITSNNKSLGFSFWLAVSASPVFFLAAAFHIMGAIAKLNMPSNDKKKKPRRLQEEKVVAPYFGVEPNFRKSPNGLPYGYRSPSPTRRPQGRDEMLWNSHKEEGRHRSPSPTRRHGHREEKRRHKSPRSERQPQEVLVIPSDYPAHLGVGTMLTPVEYQQPISPPTILAPIDYSQPMGTPALLAPVDYHQPMGTPTMLAPIHYPPPVATVLAPESYAAPVGTMLVPGPPRISSRKKTKE